MGVSSIYAVTSCKGLNAGEVSEKTVPISKVKKPLAIAMWDFSWILRHHKYGEFENWEKVVSELSERGYNAIRMDAMPQFVATNNDGGIIQEFRSVKDGWMPALWGNDYTMTFRPREALLEFLPICKKYGIKVGLASWFMPHGTSRKDIFFESGGLLRAWIETLDFLKAHNLLDNVIYVDLLNEYPTTNGYDWLKLELNKLSDDKKFELKKTDAHLPDFDNAKANDKQIAFHNQFIGDTIKTLRLKFPELDFFASYNSGGVPLEDIDLTEHDAFDYHVWFQNSDKMPNIIKISRRDQNQDQSILYKELYNYWTNNKSDLVNWIESVIDNIALKAAEQNKVCGNTEGWGPIGWYDHPELDWRWVKETGDICVDLARKHDNYKFICTSNFTHPQFKGIWNDISWHRKITDKIKG